MTRRIIVGGPKGSGKSTFVPSLVDCLKKRGRTAEAGELDVWSNSYLAFISLFDPYGAAETRSEPLELGVWPNSFLAEKGKYTFETRPKRFTLHDWDWKAAIAPRIARFNESRAEYVFGDLPGVIGAANSHTLDLVRPTDVWVYSRTLEGLADWKRFCEKDFGLHVTREFLSVRKTNPVIVPDLERELDVKHPSVIGCAHELIDAPTP